MMGYQEFKCPHCEKAVRVYDPDTLAKEKELAEARNCRDRKRQEAILAAFVAIHGVEVGQFAETPQTYGVWDRDLHVEGQMYQLEEIDNTAQDMVEKARVQIGVSGLRPEHCCEVADQTFGMVESWALRIDGCPVRLLMSYGFIQCAWTMSLDVYRRQVFPGTGTSKSFAFAAPESYMDRKLLF
jgi:hypothetical protein